MNIFKRIRFWIERQTSPNFLWGHPDEWTDAEWYFFNKHLRR